MRTIILTAFAAVGLAACATGGDDRQENACATYDWRAQGVADGAAGYGASRAADFAGQCGSNFDEAAWRSGLSEGATRFCTIEGAFRSGIAGTEYRAVCTPMPEGAEAALAKGQKYGALTVEINDREAQIYEHQIKLRSLLREQSSVTGGTPSPASTAQIGILRGEIDRLQKEILALKGQRRAYTI